MYVSNILHAVPLVGLLSLPMAANARTINLFEAEDGYQAVPENASDVAAETVPYTELAGMSISDIIKMEINGEPVTVQLHIPSEDGEGSGTDVVVFSPDYPEGILRPVTDSTSQTPLPAAAWLMMSGLVGMAAIARRRQQGKIVASRMSHNS
ncbi:MAG: VPLPA-CTERM sorting domain-containing protein [Gammaproteobacteria bacterium]|nr:VPLPA-CTERM sorting domain-containing protein [Gammaproteobacteria bacterium]